MTGGCLAGQPGLHFFLAENGWTGWTTLFFLAKAGWTTQIVMLGIGNIDVIQPHYRV